MNYYDIDELLQKLSLCYSLVDRYSNPRACVGVHSMKVKGAIERRIKQLENHLLKWDLKHEEREPPTPEVEL